MNEKKRTDEEIIKAMEICANWNSMSNCKDCPIGLDACCENQNVFAKYALDIIHRLQAENAKLREAKTVYASVDYCADDLAEAMKKIAEYERKLDDGELVSKEWHDEQVMHDKAEIERLKIDLANEKNWGKIQTRQAVKDTAKEILQKIMNIIKKSDCFLAEEVVRIMAKQNGVEVE